MAKYTDRIRKIASYIDAGESVADIGADHGYLAAWLAREGAARRVIMTDIAEGPLAAARGNAERHGFTDFRLGDGLAPLAPGEASAVVIAGMGGETIIGILAADLAKTASFAKYILQPRTKADVLRGWLSSRRYEITHESSAMERGRRCDIIVMRTGNDKE
ncbi:MAG: class I SAM-dependent methyltransferase [Clostridiales Family XIII bacterium]|jgi:tRNA (adenine22-N1)-methyltransferase|nr:class I SAM-dependent methyltransferase [Clostridiales Family XIII bacterium]